MPERILITGGTGFAGSHLVELLASTTQADIHVTTFSSPSSQPTFVRQFLPAENIHQLDLADQGATSELLQQLQPNQVYHLAALAAVGDSFAKAEATIISNTKLQLVVLNAIKEYAPQARLLVVGSAQEYDVVSYAKQASHINENHPLGPSNPYGVSKVSQDLLGLSYVYSYGLDVVRVRPFNHVGERQPQGFAVADFAAQIVSIEKAQSQKLLVGNLNPVRDFSDVKDVVKAYHLIMERGIKGEVYNVGSGRGVRVGDILDQLCELSHVTVPIEVDQAKYRPVDVATIVADITKVTKLGWQPTIPLAQTLTRVLEYWRNHDRAT